MSRFSPVELLLLALGSSLVLMALFLNHITALWDRPPEQKPILWKHLKLLPTADQQVDSLDPEMLVVRTTRFPLARLTLFTRPDDGLSPKQMVRNLCRRDTCTYSALDGSDDRLSAVATYREGEPLRIVLMRPGGREIWLEFKGPPGAFAAFSNLIDAVSQQLQAIAPASAAPES